MVEMWFTLSRVFGGFEREECCRLAALFGGREVETCEVSLRLGKGGRDRSCSRLGELMMVDGGQRTVRGGTY